MIHSRKTNNQPALLLGEGITVLGAARSLAAASIKPLLISRKGDFATWSRSGRRLPATSAEGAIDLAHLLDTIPIEHAVLMPCSDEWLAAAVALPKSLRERFPASLPPADAVRAYTDKGLFAEAVRQFDVPHPRTIDAADHEAIEQLSDTEIRGFFLKPRHSQAFSLHYRTKAVPVSSRADAIEKLERFEREGFPVELQEIIFGPTTHYYLVDGVIDRFGSVSGAMARRRIRMYPIDFGNSTMQVSIPMEDVAAAIEPLFRLLRGLNHRGIFSAEFKWDERDQLFKLLEINARPWWQVEFSTLCGVNVCEMAYRDAIADELPTVTTYAVGHRFGILAHDVRALRDLRRQGTETFGGWLSSRRGATDAINRLSDPLPAFGFAREIAAKLIRRGVGGSRSRGVSRPS